MSSTIRHIPERAGGPLTVVCGEALIDLFVSTDARGVLHSVPRLGGAPFNLAVGLARMGQNVAFCAGLSSDVFGQALRRHLIEEGVSEEFLEYYVEPTMLVVVGRQLDGRPFYGFPVPSSADRQLRAARFDGPHSAVGTLVLGSHLLVMPEPQARLLRVAAALRGKNTLVCLDPNVRLGIIPQASLWRAAFEKFAPLADLIKASDEDIEQLYPEAASPRDVAEGWIAGGAKLVVVTAGAHGATAYLGDGRVLHVPGEAVGVVDTVGAGDSFLAALLASLDGHSETGRAWLEELAPDTVEAAMRFAVAAATITCGRVGADLPDAHTVAAHLAEGRAADHSSNHETIR